MIGPIMTKHEQILNAIIEAGGTPLYVGGCVRDKILNVESKDVDVEVYGLPSSDLMAVLSRFGKVSQVGVSFAVIKLSTENEEFDFSLPRLDNKFGPKHGDVEVVVDHRLTPTQAAYRRDFTINSMARTVNGDLLDPYGGESDLMAGLLRATSAHFTEGLTVRIHRGVQFAGRFDMVVHGHTAKICKDALLTNNEIVTSDRIYGEWEKWAMKSVRPSAGLRFLIDTGWIVKYPELQALVGLDQDPEWHPEGDVITHTGLVCDAAVQIAKRDQLNDEDRLVLVMSALCHDLGKAVTTTTNEAGRIIAPGHAEAGVDLTESLMKRMGFVGDGGLSKIVDQVKPLVACHMAHLSAEPNERFVRRLADRTHPSTLKQLVRLMEADHSGRHPLPKGCPPKALQILQIAEELAIQDAKPEQILKGRHLIPLGYLPGPMFTTIIEAAYQKQLDGEIKTLDDAIEFAKTYT
jgi:tRNA nucleotidyltransferase (CCA-adding enzyme)